MTRIMVVLFLIIFLLLLECSSASANPTAKIVGGVVANVASVVFKWAWSLKPTTKTAVSSRSMIKFESGYIVETVFDGSKLGIVPYSVEVSSTGEVLILDSENSNIYRVSTPLSRYSRPKLVAGSPEGYSGHVDGRLREARMDHPKGLTMDNQGNIYVADTVNMAIRKISDAGVVTIAGGMSVRGGGHLDGPSEDAKFSDDFDVVYVGSSCSLLVIDRGNQAIREIQLNDDDCSPQFDDNNLQLGVALLCSAVFFGYMLALLQRRIGALLSSNSNDQRDPVRGMKHAPYQRNMKSVRPPLIPSEDEYEKEDENLFVSLGRLVMNTGSTVVEIFGGMFSGFRKSPYPQHVQQHYHYSHKQSSAWPMQESYAIRDEDEAPSLDTRDPTPRKTYPIMNKDTEKARHMRQSQLHYGGRSSNAHGHGNFQQQQQQYLPQVYQHHDKHQSSSPQTYYEQSCETKEIVFGAVQEQDGRRETMVIKAVDYGDPAYNSHNVRSRYNYNSGYSFGY
ncbi:hypothetical protein T459_06879 [Capsicum annuum]|uniref:NHL repeat-containing protein 2 n=1 Tax=Capsicum annuum TaxID=4072 RepID=A0A2G3ABZ1_CAPAN|nr:uncharacterized protein LOC107860623 [Capsicum annuum]PHT91766.1 hypothetical protein T459_06879 [Capsicum annuum]